MKKLIALVAVLAVASAVYAAKKVAINPEKAAELGDVPQESSLLAKVSLAEDGNQLWCHVRILGIAHGRTIEPVIKWTAPEVVYTNKKGEKTLIFQNSEWKGKKLLGDPDIKNPPCRCTDTGQKNCARTKAFRTLKTEASGKTYTATGTWKVEVLVDGVVIGSAEYLVK